jgi:hypothetical protein
VLDAGVLALRGKDGSDDLLGGLLAQVDGIAIAAGSQKERT